jgi:simple sugar transport system ATP-binding protein
MRVEIKDIRKYFGPVKANDGINFVLEPGRVYGLLGENGAGKSTLMKILSGFQPADSGEMLFDGKMKHFDFPADALKAGIGMLYQEPLDLPPFKVLENYQLGRGDGVFLNQKEAAAELRSLGKRYEFEIDLDEFIEDLSVGERQQLELIRLLAGGAEVLILDEPTTGISAGQKDLLFDSMRKLAHEEGKTLILVSHKLAEVQELCDHVFVVRSGKIVGQKAIPCPTDELVELMFGQVPERSQRPTFPMGELALEIRDLSIATYRLDMGNLNLSIRKGEIFGLAGLEGSGQDLLVKACTGLLKPEKGKILLDGEDISSHSYHQIQQAGISYIAAGRLEEGLVAGLSLTEHMVMAAQEHSFFIDWEGTEKTTWERIEKYQVVGEPNSLIDQLSGGNQQRFLFAMLNSPLKLILMEQPTRGLDILSVNWIWDQLYKRREEGTAIMFISADLDEIIERSDRVAAFSGGVMSRIVDAEKTSVDELGHLIGGQQ